MLNIIIIIVGCLVMGFIAGLTAKRIVTKVTKRTLMIVNNKIVEVY